MGGWTESYERLCLLDQVSPLEPAQLIELAISAYLIGKDAESVATLIRAHQGCVQRGDRRLAGGIAARLASIAMSMGDAAQAAGWMARATRLLDESGPFDREHLAALEPEDFRRSSVFEQVS